MKLICRNSLLFFFCIALLCVKQIIGQDTMSAVDFKDATFIPGNLGSFIAKHVKYPNISLVNGEDGYVIISFVIGADGKIGTIESFINNNSILNYSSIEAIKKTAGQWQAATLNNEPVEKEYKVVFNYKISPNQNSSGYLQKANKFLKKAKYEKALKFYDKTIEDNKFLAGAYLSRSQVKNTLGDIKGAEEDLKTFKNYTDKFLLSITVRAVAQPQSNIIYGTKQR